MLAYSPDVLMLWGHFPEEQQRALTADLMFNTISFILFEGFWLEA